MRPLLEQLHVELPPAPLTQQELFVSQLRDMESYVESVVVPDDAEVTWAMDDKTKWVTGTHHTTYPAETGQAIPLAISQRLGPNGHVGYTLATPQESLAWQDGETKPSEVVYHVIGKFNRLERETRVPHFAVERFLGKITASEAVIPKTLSE